MEMEMALFSDCQFSWLFLSFWSLHVFWPVLEHNSHLSLWVSPSVSVSVFPSPLPLTSILLSLFSLLPGLFTFLHLAVRQKSPVFLRPQFRNKVYIAGPGISSQSDSWFITDPVTTSYIMLQTSINSVSGTLSDLISWIYLPFLLYNYKGFDLCHTWMV